ncbi:hypothetical protein Tco_1291378 [Tanacetum coccineum]
MVLLRVPRKHNLYTFNLNTLAPKENLACLMAKAFSTEAEYVVAANCCGQAFDGPRFNHLVVNIGMLNP